MYRRKRTWQRNHIAATSNNQTTDVATSGAQQGHAVACHRREKCEASAAHHRGAKD
jgi:hypothetical protein